MQSTLPAGAAGQGLPSGQIWALYFEPFWVILAATETLAVATNNAIVTALKTNVRVALFRIANINPPRFSDKYLPSKTLPNANTPINALIGYVDFQSRTST